MSYDSVSPVFSKARTSSTSLYVSAPSPLRGLHPSQRGSADHSLASLPTLSLSSPPRKFPRRCRRCWGTEGKRERAEKADSGHLILCVSHPNLGGESSEGKEMRIRDGSQSGQAAIEDEE